MFEIKEVRIECGCDCWGRIEYNEAYDVYYDGEFVCKTEDYPTILEGKKLIDNESIIIDESIFPCNLCPDKNMCSYQNRIKYSDKCYLQPILDKINHNKVHYCFWGDNNRGKMQEKNI